MHRHPDLIAEHVDRERFRTGTRYSIALSPVAYAIGAALAWVYEPAAFLCYAAIARYFVFPHTVRERR